MSGADGVGHFTRARFADVRQTSIRGGGGIFYGSVSGNEWNTVEPSALRRARQFPNAVADEPIWQSAGRRVAVPHNYSPTNQFIYPATICGFAKNFKWPYTYQFNLTVERQITKDLSWPRLRDR
jgi:hypothetical protein